VNKSVHYMSCNVASMSVETATMLFYLVTIPCTATHIKLVPYWGQMDPLFFNLTRKSCRLLVQEVHQRDLSVYNCAPQPPVAMHLLSKSHVQCGC
jgi:hypothetical protein